MSVKGLPDDGMRNKTTDHGPVLSYKAACLWREDALTLLPGNWLNDNILVWWYEFLAHDIYAGRKDVCLLHPGASFLCLYEHPDELVDTFKTLRIEDRALLFFPLNDSTTEENSGTHWSLLVFSSRANTFFHYDSVPNSPNIKVAEHVADVAWFLLLRLMYRDKTTERPATVTPPLAPQVDSADCGVYVAFITNAVILAGGCVDFREIATPLAIRSYRGHMNVTLSRSREEYEQLRGKTISSRVPEPTLMRPGALRAANPPNHEDLEYVRGEFEDDVEGEVALARAKRLAERRARIASAADSGLSGR